MSESRRIAIFGGTFDPVHRGHVFMAQRAREELALDEVMFVPCRISPHKLGTTTTSAADRVAMLQRAMAGQPWMTVSELELGRAGPSFSWQTAEILTAQQPSARWFWLMGGDQWEALPRWARPEYLAELVEFIVMVRHGVAPAPRPGYRLHVITGDHPASATAIRGGVADGMVPSDWLDPEVASFIEEHQLYR